MSSFAENMQQAIENSLLAFIKKGEWIRLDYSNKVNLSVDELREMYKQIDKIRLMRLVAAKIEERMADAIYNAMATEIANDVKSIMCNKELRQDIRDIVRDKIKEATSQRGILSLPLVCGSFLADTDLEYKLISYNKKYGVPMPYIYLIFFLIVCVYPILVVSVPFLIIFKIIYSLVINFKAFKSSIKTLLKDKLND